MPPVSEAQRRLMHAAASTKGGAGGVSQAVGKEFSGADKPGKLPERKSPASRLYKSKGYAEGGHVDLTDAERAKMLKYLRDAKREEDGRREGVDVDKAADEVRGEGWKKRLDRQFKNAKDADQNVIDPTFATRDANEVRSRDVGPPEIGLARGGVIKQVAGKPIGKDDGLIAAQRGEFVVRKDAVKKLGLPVLNEINKGRLPSERLYGRKAVARG